jgi:hypothetical protein
MLFRKDIQRSTANYPDGSELLRLREDIRIEGVPCDANHTRRSINPVLGSINVIALRAIPFFRILSKYPSHLP